MRSLRKVTWLILLGGCCCPLGNLFAADPPNSPQSKAVTNSQAPPFVPPKFSVPEGFTVELAAAPPLVKHPMMATFDERGRLFIAESAGLNLRSDDLEAQLPNFVRMLEDTNGDGVFDKSTIFADKMTFPMGGAWHDGSLYVASPPNIWRLTDTDDDGVADEREILVGRFGYTGNAADIHGCFAGPDGRIYWCDGRHGHEFEDENGKVISRGKAARIFSCRPDGSDVQVHCGGGMDNPVEIDFHHGGDMLGTVNLFYRQRGDCLVHWMRGGVYPREDQVDCIAEFRRTGDLLPPVIDFGHVAVSGTTRYRGASLGADYQNNFFVTEFNTHSVTRVVLTASGSTYEASSEPFFKAESDDFHPTDVLEDADGSLLVIDTGGWFRIGCPTSQIAKPDISGAIYRIRRQDAPIVEDSRGLDLAWINVSGTELRTRLSDPRFAVRERAIIALARQGAKGIPALRYSELENAPYEAQIGAIWALTRMNLPEAQVAVRGYLSAPIGLVRQTAIFSAGQTHDPSAVTKLSEMVTTEVPPLRRAAATSLGQLKDSAAIPSLLAALAKEDNDALLEHALIYALIEIGVREKVVAGLAHDSPRVRRGALIALDQMTQGNLTREEVMPLLDGEHPALRAAALDVMGRHPDWAKEIVALLKASLTEKPAEDNLSFTRGLLAAFCQEEEIQRLIGDVLIQPKADGPTRRMLLEVVGRSGIKPLPEAWGGPLSHLLAEGDLETRIATVEALATADDGSFRPQLSLSVADDKLPRATRDAALLLMARNGSTLQPDELARLVELLKSDEAVDRLGAVTALAGAEMTYDQAAQLLPFLEKAGPLELPGLVQSLRYCRRPMFLVDMPDQEAIAFAKQWLPVLEKSSGKASLSVRQLEEILVGYPAEVHTAAEPLIKSLETDSSERQAILAELLPRMDKGKIERGKDVFYSQRATCSSCHRIENRGGQIGPNLSEIGKRRNRRDLLEAIIFPSASLARDFESYSVMTDGGQIHTGLVIRQTSRALTLRTTQQKEVTIARSEIEELIPSPISVMPQGFDRILNDQQLRDLLAYLESLK